MNVNEIIILIVYFMIYAFIGWILESVYKSVLQKKIINSGFLLGPICPIYGYGALIMYLSLKDVTDNIIILFLYGLIVLSVFEYIVGLFLEIAFKTKYWDYSNKKFNIHGRVCLQNSLYWGVLGIIFMKGIHPFVEKIVDKIPLNYLIIFVGITVTLMIIDTISTLVRLIKINSMLKKWKEITNNIKDRVEAVNLNNALKHDRIKQLQMDTKYKFLHKLAEIKRRENVLGDMKLRQKEIQAKLEKKISRLNKAFPTMKSERLSNFLNNTKKS